MHGTNRPDFNRSRRLVFQIIGQILYISDPFRRVRDVAKRGDILLSRAERVFHQIDQRRCFSVADMAQKKAAHARA